MSQAATFVKAFLKPTMRSHIVSARRHIVRKARRDGEAQCVKSYAWSSYEMSDRSLHAPVGEHAGPRPGQIGRQEALEMSRILILSSDCPLMECGMVSSPIGRYRAVQSSRPTGQARREHEG
eukprot:gnl/TRDRNA2_/TRDRNA2_178076_c0_seq1.p1 gnl/TRDRNA2_/TRDRNA2_178076_c0~~gnl/TRDRNA2_/TRDRNA2_178076_c0_seq1.p1  ORF type:complete len:122 (+),score=6.16 gnl/TRDRNA2_/TRDRNA2_178076_c0_seq1:241-606(+)